MNKRPKQNKPSRKGAGGAAKNTRESPAGGSKGTDPESSFQRVSSYETQPSTSSAAVERDVQKPCKLKPGAKGGSKSGEPDRWIKSAVEQYYLTQHYTTAVAEGFCTYNERIRFNTWVLQNQGSIDPKVGSYCRDCGDVSLMVCHHKEYRNDPVLATPEHDDPAVLFSVPSVISWRFTALEQLRDWFRLPKFNPALNRNPYISGFDTQLVEDVLVNDKMASYIRLHLNTSYKINGVYDREAKVSHCHKLALRFCDEEKISHAAKCQPGFVNSMQLTVQRCADSGMEEMLFAESSGVKNGFWNLLNFPRARPSRNHLIMAGVLVFAASPTLRRKVITAVVKTKLFIFRKYFETNTDIILIGSGHALRTAAMLIRYVSGAMAASIWNLTARLC